MFRWALLCLSLCQLLLTCCWALLGSLAPSSLFAPITYLYPLMRSPLSLLFSRLKSPSSLSLSSYERCSSPLIVCVLDLTPLSPCPSLVLWSPDLVMQCSRRGLTSAEYRGRITSFDLWALLSITQPRCWPLLWRCVAGSWSAACPPGPQGPSLQRYLPAGWPSVYMVLELIPLQSPRQDFAFPLIKLHEVPLEPVLQLVKVPLSGSTTMWCFSHSSQFCVICELAEVRSVTISRSLMKLLNSISHSNDPWVTPLVTCLQLDFVLLITTLQAGPFSQFSICLAV